MIPNTIIFEINISSSCYRICEFLSVFTERKILFLNFQLFYLNNGTHGIWFSLFLSYNSLYFSKNETFTSILYFFFYFVLFLIQFFFILFLFIYIYVYFFYFIFTRLKIWKTDCKINQIIFQLLCNLLFLSYHENDSEIICMEW